jgi:molybdopterin molybdotransferase
MLQLEEALDQILAVVDPLGSESVPLNQAGGRIVAATVCSPLDLPPFDNSAVDGYAVRVEDLALARRDQPVSLPLAGRVVAGEPSLPPLLPGSCVRVLTGSALPSQADAVVMQEEAEPDPARPGWVRFLSPVVAGENVRPRAEDVRCGAPVLAAGDRLSAGGIGLLSAIGLTEVVVGRRPRVSVLATGSELVEPGTPLPPGRIYESNRWMLAELTRQAGGLPQLFPPVPDTLADTRNALERAFADCDAVVSCGGVSVGELDHVRPAFEQCGGHLDFWKLAVRPGRPFAFGRCGSKVLFGLPGNPVSALVTFVLLARPALIRMQGGRELGLPVRHGVLAESLGNDSGRRHFLRVHQDQTGQVRSAGLQASHALKSLAACNGLLDLPRNTTWAPGSAVRVLRLD